MDDLLVTVHNQPYVLLTRNYHHLPVPIDVCPFKATSLSLAASSLQQKLKKQAVPLAGKGSHEPFEFLSGIWSRIVVDFDRSVLFLHQLFVVNFAEGQESADAGEIIHHRSFGKAPLSQRIAEFQHVFLGDLRGKFPSSDLQKLGDQMPVCANGLLVLV
jgi:hypothetical protein